MPPPSSPVSLPLPLADAGISCRCGNQCPAHPFLFPQRFAEWGVWGGMQQGRGT